MENAEEAVFEEKKIEEQEVVFLMDRFGYAQYRRSVSTMREIKRQQTVKTNTLCSCMNTGKLCLFTNTGKMHQIKATGSSVWKVP